MLVTTDNLTQTGFGVGRCPSCYFCNQPGMTCCVQAEVKSSEVSRAVTYFLLQVKTILTYFVGCSGDIEYTT